MKPKKPKRPRTKAEIAREYGDFQVNVKDWGLLCVIIDDAILAALNAWDRERTRREKAKAKKA